MKHIEFLQLYRDDAAAARGAAADSGVRAQGVSAGGGGGSLWFQSTDFHVEELLKSFQ